MTDLNTELVHDACHFLKKFDGEFKGQDQRKQAWKLLASSVK